MVLLQLKIWIFEFAHSYQYTKSSLVGTTATEVGGDKTGQVVTNAYYHNVLLLLEKANEEVHCLLPMNSTCREIELQSECENGSQGVFLCKAPRIPLQRWGRQSTVGG